MHSLFPSDGESVCAGLAVGEDKRCRALFGAMEGLVFGQRGMGEPQHPSAPTAERLLFRVFELSKRNPCFLEHPSNASVELGMRNRGAGIVQGEGWLMGLGGEGARKGNLLQHLIKGLNVQRGKLFFKSGVAVGAGGEQKFGRELSKGLEALLEIRSKPLLVADEPQGFSATVLEVAHGMKMFT